MRSRESGERAPCLTYSGYHFFRSSFCFIYVHFGLALHFLLSSSVAVQCTDIIDGIKYVY